MPEKVINYQSPYTDQSLIEYLAGGTLETCVCWLLTASDDSVLAGTKVGATSHTRDLVLPGHSGVTFKRAGGAGATTVDTEAGQESAGLQMQFVIDDDVISEESLAAGDWAGAQFEIFTVCYRELKMGQLIEFSGRLGRVDQEGKAGKAEARPLTAVAQNRIGRLVKGKCDAKRFADKFEENRCKLDPDGVAPDGGRHSVTGTVTTDGAHDEFVDSSRTETSDDYFGEVKFLTGQNAGRLMEVRTYVGAQRKFKLQRPLPYPVAAGDTYKARRFCNRMVSDCRKFGNIINHRGFPYVTNIEEINRIKRAK
ncbi:MAG TPA: DUF2163 domain-containing protein [Pyrinomonadaceae bacterium]|nr:DUF2163 domain-containing protein [Pyrinomonadaceae bacterium]